MPSRDTSERAHAIQTAILRSQSPAEKFRAAVEMSDFTRKLAEAGLRQRRPDIPDAEIPRALAELLYSRRRNP